MEVDELEDSTSSSPARRGRSGTLIPLGPPSDENFNEMSNERMELLEKFHTLLQKPVPRAFWAVLMFADIPMVKKLLDESEKSRYLLEFCMHACTALPLIWKQKEPRLKNADSSSASSKSSGRNSRIRDLAAERDRQRCVVSGISPFEYFWTPDRVQSWYKEIFRNDNSDRQIDSIVNQMCLCPNIHSMWIDGNCAFRPLEYNEGKTELSLEWHWQPTVQNADSVIAINTPSPSSRNLDQHVGTSGGPSMAFLSARAFVRTGDIVVLKTRDPDRLPLPSKALLDMAFVLARVVNLSGAAGYPDLLNFDDWDWLTQVELSSGRSDSGDSDDETGTQATSELDSPASKRRAQPTIQTTTYTEAIPEVEGES
ncbi:hypothetical protein BJX96DRAFT_167297 [Aspergillus floccosus]